MAEPEFRHALVACARWEARYIVEWLTYHQLIGFDHVFLYCNDDDPAEFIDQVLPFTQGPRPFVSLRHHREQGQQTQMYQHFLKTDRHRCAWIGFLDIDEFLRLPAGETIGQFLAGYQDHADLVLFNWLFFGPNFHKTPPAGTVLENYTRRAATIHCLTKYIARAALFADARFLEPGREHGFWHWPGELAAGWRAVNVLHEDISGYFEGFPERPTAWVNEPARQAAMLRSATIHHYSFRSEQNFFDRAARGQAGDFAAQANWREVAQAPDFELYLASINAAEDLGLADVWSAIRRQARAATIIDSPFGTLLSRGKPATQSSICEWSFAATKEADAAGAVNGLIDGLRKFHTGLEDHPWWQVDLTGPAEIREIRIYNTSDHTAFRFRDFSLAVSIDGTVWAELARKQDGEVLVARDGAFIWRGPGTAWARYVRVTLLARDFLHLDQVEVFGRLISGSA